MNVYSLLKSLDATEQSDLLIGFALMMTADLDPHFPVKPFQKIEQLVRCEAAEMSVHQMRNIGLRNSKDARDFALFQLFVLENSENVNADLRARIKLAGILQTQINEDIAGAFLKLNWISSFHPHAPTPVLPCIASQSAEFRHPTAFARP